MIDYLLAAAVFAATPCENLKTLALADTTITIAEVIAVGPLSRQPGSTPLPAGIPTAKAPETGAPGYFPNERPIVVAAHCRVEAVIRPSADSEIGMELWLPTDQWNGKFEMFGNGGWAGRALTPWRAMNQGYATAWTDTGHQGASGAFALGHPEKVIDFAYRAVHETAIKSKAIIAAFYGPAPRLSYFDGCSTRGRQALMEAQRYPEDFDGILAAAPANNMTSLAVWRFAMEVNVRKKPASIVQPTKLAMVNRAVLAACDARDGVVDEILSDPRQCRFDPATLLCRDAETDNCLTPSQVDAFKAGYTPAARKNGQLIFPGMVPGAEARWIMLTANTPEPGTLNDLDLFKYVVHEDPKWDWHTFDIDRETQLAEEKAGYLNASDPDLSAFKARGGKLIMYHGWNDGGNGGAIPPQNSVNYYESVLKKMGAQQDNWFRLFMVPGMAHCFGGPGPDQVNWIGALERWREAGIAPDQPTASRVDINNQVDMTRPVCPYPKIPKYSGIGSTNDAANFACQMP
jgi:feruloyl esterase